MAELTANPFTRVDPIAPIAPPIVEQKSELQLLDEDLARRKRARAPESKPPFLQRLATGPVGDIFSELLEGTAPFAEVPAGLIAGMAAGTARPVAAAGALPGEGQPFNFKENIVSDLVRGVDPRPKARARARQFDEDVAPAIPQPQGRISRGILEAVDKPFAAARNDLTNLGINEEDAQLLIEAGLLFAPAGVKGIKAGVKGTVRQVGKFRARRIKVGPRGGVGLTKQTDPGSINVSLKKADVTKELAEIGIEVEKADRVTFEASLDQAKDVLAKDATAGTRLATEALESARALNPVEKATLLHERVRLSNLRDEMGTALETAQKGKDPLAIDTAKANLEAVQTDYQSISEAALLQGRESGLSLAFQKMLLKRDFSLANLERQRRTIKGKALDPKELQQTKELFEGIDKSQKKLDVKVKELKEGQEASRGSIEKIFEEPAREGETGRGSPDPNAIQTEGTRGLSPEEGRRHDTMFFRVEQGKESIAPNSLTPIDRGLSTDIQAVKPGEAIVGYDFQTGQYKVVSSKFGNEINVLKKFEKLLESKKPELIREIESVKKARAELGLDPDTGFKLERESTPKQKPKSNVTFEEQAAAIDAEITRLELGKEPADVNPQLRLKLKRIKEFKLEAQRETARTGKRSPNNERARQQLDAIETEINKIRGIRPEGDVSPQGKLPLKKKVTDAELTKRAVASLERSIKELETRIKEKDLASKRNPFTTPATPEVRALRFRRDALRKELSELRKLQKDKKSPEQIRLQRLKTRLKNETARLQKRLELKDFAEKEKIPLELDKEASQLLVENEAAKEAFNEALFKDKLAQQSVSKQIISGAAETLNMSRAIITSLDLSAVARQGGFIGFGNPIRAAKSFPAMIKALRSEAGQAAVMAEIKGRKNFPLMRQSKLFFAERGKGLIGQEEVYMSRHVDKIPLVAASQRAYVTFLNKLRADSFDALVKSLGKNGVVTLAESKSIANYVNVATGRGSVTASTTALVNMNTVFFAPRLVLSRFQLLTGQPLRAASSPRVRALIVKEYAKFMTGLGVMYAIGQLAGGEVEVDLRSSDFSKIRFGNTRIDVLTGIAQVSTFTARLASGQIKGLKSGKVTDLTGSEARKFGNKDLFDVLSTFFRSKLSPVVSTAIDVKVETDIIGDQVTLESATANLLTPLVLQDILEAMKEQGVPQTVALSLLAILGFGLQTFDVRKRRREDRRGFFSADRLKQKGRAALRAVGLADDPNPAPPPTPATSEKSNLKPNPFNR